MINLAGYQDCDKVIKEELLIAGVDIVQGERHGGEVPYSITGKLGNFTFKRAWAYWMVNGDVPYNVAEEIYDNEYGKSDVRCGGNCACPHPSQSAIPRPDAIMALGLERTTFGEIYRMCNEGKITAPRFVSHYHIDSQIGLKVFVDAITKHGLV